MLWNVNFIHGLCFEIESDFSYHEQKYQNTKYFWLTKVGQSEKALLFFCCCLERIHLKIDSTHVMCILSQ